MTRSSIPWARMLGEGVVIVGSILLAFALDAGWDRLQEREWERSQLSSLHTELEENLGLAERSIGIHGGMERGLVGLREWSLASPPGHEEALPARQVNALFSFRTTEFSLGAIDALVSSGDLGRIRSEEIRRVLTMWRRELGDVREKETLALQFAEMVLMPALAGQGFAGDATLVRPPTWTPPEDARISVRASPEFSDLVASRIVHERLAIQNLERLAAETRRMLELLEAEMAR